MDTGAASRSSRIGNHELARLLQQQPDSTKAAVASGGSAPCAACSAGLPCERKPKAAQTLGSGSRLPAAVAARLQPVVNVDLADVRVHTGPAAAAAAQSLEASAFTLGRHVVFDEGAYRPGTRDGDGLIAHELAHVAQQATANAPQIQRRPAPSVTRKHKRDRCDKYDVPEDPCAGLTSAEQRALLPEGRGFAEGRQMDIVAQTLKMSKEHPGEYVERVRIAVCALNPQDAAAVREAFETRSGTAGKEFGELSTASRCKILFALDARVAEGAARRRQVLEETIEAERKTENRRREQQAAEAQRQAEEQAKLDQYYFEKAGQTGVVAALFPSYARHTLRTHSGYIKNPLLRFHAGINERARSVPLLVASTEPIVRPIATIMEFVECMLAQIRGESVSAISDAIISDPLDALDFPVNFNQGVVIGIGQELAGIAELIKDLFTDPMKLLEQAEQLLKLLWSPDSMEIACALGGDLGEHFDKELVKLAGKGVDAIATELGKLAGPAVLWTLISLVAPYVTAAVKGTTIFRRLLKLLDKLGDVGEGLKKLLKKKKHDGDGDKGKPPESKKPPEGEEGTFHGGRSTVSESTLKIDGEDHELLVVDDMGRISLRLCSDDCGPVVQKLRVTRDETPDTPDNARLRAKLDELIKEGEQLEESFQKTPDRAAWKARASEYAAKLEAAGKEFPNEMGAMTGTRVPIPGDVEYKGRVPAKSWRITPSGEGAHLIERVNTRGRPHLGKFDKLDTPRFYPDGTPEQAGQAHLRIHDATKKAGIKLQGGNPSMTDDQLLNSYRKAYSDSSLDGIRGDLRLPDGTVVAKGVTVKEAFDELVRWGGR